PAISTLSLHDALPIFGDDLACQAFGDAPKADERRVANQVEERIGDLWCLRQVRHRSPTPFGRCRELRGTLSVDRFSPRTTRNRRDRKSTRLNSSHLVI